MFLTGKNFSRPVTQQGMTGIQSQRPSSGINRSYHDKRYHIAAIQNHILAISEETNRLKKQLADNKLDATNYKECKKQVEDYRKQLEEHEETLITYNTAIESNMLKGDRSDIDAEAERLRRIIQDKINQVEQIFSNKLTKEEQITELQEKIKNEDQLFENMISSLPENLQQRYFALKQQNDHLKKEEESMKNEIEQLTKSISQNELSIVHSETQNTRYHYMMKIHDLDQKIQKLKSDNKIKRTPSQEREYLLNQVKQDRAAIDSFKTQTEELNSELQKLEERHTQLEDELSEKNSARINKYRELLKRQETMDSFLDTFDSNYAEQLKKIEEVKSNIVFALEYISSNLAEANLEEVDSVQKFTLNSNAPKEQVLKEYKKLKSQLAMYESLKERTLKEIQENEKKNDEFEKEIEKFVNVEQSRTEIMDNISDLEVRRETLKDMLKSTLSAITEAERKKSSLENQLEGNETYKTITELEDKINKADEECNKLTTELNSNNDFRNFESLKNESLKFAEEINNNLKQKLKKK